MDIELALEASLRGGAILFCGAGFSSDCLNFGNVEIGASYPLLELLNERLDYEFDDLQAAADEFLEKFPKYELQTLLKERYQVSRVPRSIEDIVRYPWDRIYTTNYDDAISQALQSVGKKHQRVNNLDHIRGIPESGGTWVVHLHGAAECWDVHNFEESCVLGAQSYYQNDSANRWKTELENDFNRSSIFVFIGFSARDYYLNKVFYNASSSRDKVFFINPVGSQENRQLIATQRKFGHSLAIGRDGFAEFSRAACAKKTPEKPQLASFEEVLRPDPSESVPGIDDVTRHMVFGDTDDSFLVRDIDRGTSDYRVRRSCIDNLLNHLSGGGAIGLVTGSVCTGKSLLAREVALDQLRRRPVFWLRIAYSDVLKEARAIIDSYPDCLICVEECFLLGDVLVELAEVVSMSSASLLLTSRDVSFDAASDDLIASVANRDGQLQRFQLSKLDEEEISSLILISDRIAGWGGLSGKSKSWKYNYISNGCHSNLAEFLLRILRSDVIRSRVNDEYHKCIDARPALSKPIVTALYLQHIGLPVQLEVLSSILEMDVGVLLNAPSEKPKNEFIRRDGSYVRTLPSIGARDILRSVIDDQYIVRVVIEIVHKLSENRRYGTTYQHIFNQFMRYPILQGVVSNRGDIESFFDQLSLHPWVNRQSHFWLQFSMEKTDFGEFSTAEEYLDTAYSIAKSHQERGRNQRYRQLDDQRAKLLLRSRTKADHYTDYFNTIKECYQLINRILDMGSITFHIYDTLSLFCDFVEKRYPDDFSSAHYSIVRGIVFKLYGKAKNRAETLIEPHDVSKAEIALAQFENLISKKNFEMTS